MKTTLHESFLDALRKSVRIWSFSGPHFPGIQAEYGHSYSRFPDSIQIGENADQKNSKHGHFLRSDDIWINF